MKKYGKGLRRKKLTENGLSDNVPTYTINKTKRMKTKTLVLAALMCVASAASSMAQSVYSANAVGYVTLTIAPGFSMIANQLNGSATTIPNLITGCPVGTQVYKFNPATQGYNIVQYFGNNIWTPAASSMTLAPGEGVFIKNPATTNFTLTFVGSVPTGTLNNVIPSGFSIVSSQVPQSGLLSTDMGFPAVIGDAVYLFNGTGYSIRNCFGNNIWNNGGEPNVAVGQSFFVKKGTQTTWTRTFSVNN